MSNSNTKRDWDLVVYGATGDAGTAIALYVSNNIDAYKKKSKNDNDDDDRFRWAIAGRSENKLNRLRSRIIVTRTTPSAKDEIGVLVADSASTEDMKELAKSTRVLISAVGPYSLLGESIYRACVENGTHYVDITGEVDWVDDMRSKYQQKAKETGATLCSFAGYDCVPCDLTTHLARKVLSEQNLGGKVDNPTLVSLESVIEATSGAFPRGTIRTTISKLGDSASFCGKLIRFASSGKKIHWKTTRALIEWLLPRWSSEYGAFTLPHFMGWCNIPVIYYSHDNAIDCTFHDRMAVPYSKDCLLTGYGLLQTLVTYLVLVGFGPFVLFFQILVALVPSISSALLKIFDSLQYRGNRANNQQVLEDAVTNAYNYATGSDGTKVAIHLRVKGDPGIKCTALLAAETSFSMLQLLDRNELPKGVIGTPSQIAGDTLCERLGDEATIGDSCSLKVKVFTSESRNKKKD